LNQQEFQLIERLITSGLNKALLEEMTPVFLIILQVLFL